MDPLFERGKIREAYQRSAATLSLLPAGDHPFRDTGPAIELAKRLHEHGVLAWHAARFADADTALTTAFSLRTRSLGPTHGDTLDTQERLAALAHYQLQPDADERFTTVITALGALHGTDHVRVAVARRNYATKLRDTGKFADARLLLDTATIVLERDLPPEHPDVIAGLKADALLHLSAGAAPAARQIATRATERATKTHGAEHPFTAAAELTLARADVALGDVKVAGKRYPSIVARLEAGYGEHPMVAIALQHWANLEKKLANNFKRARELAERGFAMYRGTYPRGGLSVAWTLFEVLMEGGWSVDAGELAVSLDADLTRSVRAAMSGRLANTFVKVGDYKRALPWLERARDNVESDEIREQWAANAAKWKHYLTRFE